jgi:dienelactone hydrolase
MMEKAFKFGKKEHIVGVATLPEDIDDYSKRPAILLLNAGLLHRVGPYRLSVHLGRFLASDGYMTMRFDLSGIGDSLINPDISDYQDIVKNDIQDTMDFINERYKINEFILIGLCSGATNAHYVASKDARIKGIVTIDGFLYKTLRFYYYEYKPYITNPVKLITTARNLALKWFKKFFQRSEKQFQRGNMFSYEFPPRNKIANDYKALVQRETAILCIYSGGISNYYNYPTQFLDMFKDVDFKDQLELHHFPKADHTFTSNSERTKLIECIRQWIKIRYNESAKQIILKR